MSNPYLLFPFPHFWSTPQPDAIWLLQHAPNETSFIAESSDFSNFTWLDLCHSNSVNDVPTRMNMSHLEVFSKILIPVAHPENSYHIWHSVSLHLYLSHFPQVILMCSQVQEPLDYVISETLLALNPMSLFSPDSSEIWKLCLILILRNLFPCFPWMLYSLPLAFTLFPIYRLPEEIGLSSFNDNCSQIYVSTTFEF